MFAVYYPRFELVQEEDRRAVMEELATAHLEGVVYRPTCTSLGDMEKGVGTVAMLKSAMTLLKVLFPAVTGATLKDSSRTDCALGTSVSLRHSYLARHSMTWYQAHFGARPSNSDVLADLAKGAAKMASPLQESFDDFFENVVNANKGYRVRVKNYKEELRKYYEGDVNEGISPSSSYAEFVQRLNDNDCILLESWIERFVDDAFGLAARGDYFWKIDIPELDRASRSSFKVKLLDPREALGGGLETDVEPAKSYWRPQANFGSLEFLDVPRMMR